MLSFLWYLFVRGLLAGLQGLPLETARSMSRTLAGTAYRLIGPIRQRTLNHIRRAYGEALTANQAEAMAREVFATVTRHICDAVFMTRRPGLLPRMENVHALDEAYALGKGVVIVTAHLGSFGLLNLIPRHLNVRTAVILKRQKNRHLLEWVSKTLRERLGVEVILKPEAKERIPEFLRRGYVVVFFADQHSISGGFTDTFFGLPAVVPAGPTLFAQRYRAPIVVATIASDGEGGSVAQFEGPVSNQGSLEDVTRRWNRMLENRVREHPGQWMWMHRRWRIRDRMKVAP